MRYWRGRGLKAIIYLDDGIVTVKGRAKATVESAKVKQDLESAGLIVNVEKCVWEPSCKIEWLGFYIDLALGEFSVPAEKISTLKVKLSEAKQETPPSKAIGQYNQQNNVNVPCIRFGYQTDDQKFVCRSKQQSCLVSPSKYNI